MYILLVVLFVCFSSVTAGNGSHDAPRTETEEIKAIAKNFKAQNELWCVRKRAQTNRASALAAANELYDALSNKPKQQREVAIVVHQLQNPLNLTNAATKRKLNF